MLTWYACAPSLILHSLRIFWLLWICASRLVLLKARESSALQAWGKGRRIRAPRSPREARSKREAQRSARLVCASREAQSVPEAHLDRHSIWTRFPLLLPIFFISSLLVLLLPLVLLLVELLLFLFSQDANLLLPFVTVTVHTSLIFINILNC